MALGHWPLLNASTLQVVVVVLLVGVEPERVGLAHWFSGPWQASSWPCPPPQTLVLPFLHALGSTVTYHKHPIIADPTLPFPPFPPSAVTPLRPN